MRKFIVIISDGKEEETMRHEVLFVDALTVEMSGGKVTGLIPAGQNHVSPFRRSPRR